MFGLLAALGAIAQINPIWIYGPYSPVSASSSSQPDWYIGFLSGALRLMPGWETSFLGHTVAWDVLIPGVLLPISFFLLMGVYPRFEQWVVGDLREHQVLDRPRNMPAAPRSARPVPAEQRAVIEARRPGPAGARRED